MAHLLLVRHGESTWNAMGRWQGHADPPLSELGEQQAHEAAGRLTPLGLTAAVSSDLRRARHTAGILAARLGLGAVLVEPGLRERDVGEWSGCTTAEIDDRWPGLRAAWRRGEVASPPGGEDGRAFAARVVAAVRAVAGDAAGPVVVVAHGGVIRALEREAGEEALTLPNLGGRWFDVDGRGVTAGPVVALLDPGTPAAAPVF